MEKLVFKVLLKEDIEKLTPMMKAAFDQDTFLHLNKKEGGPTGYDNGEFLREWGLHKDATSFTVYFENDLVGAVILWINPLTNIHKLGCVFIDPSYQDKHLGTDIWKKIESMYPDTIMWQTETPLYSKRNLHFYVNKCGFEVVGKMNEDNLEEGCYLFEKRC